MPLSIRTVMQFIRLPRREQVLYLEALMLTGAARLAMVLLPEPKLMALLGTRREETPLEPVDAANADMKKIGRVVAIISRHTPWKSKCLVQALAARAMLNRRGIENTLYLGVAKDGQNGMVAHAWLRSGTEVVTGGPEYKRFAVVAHFTAGGKRG